MHETSEPLSEATIRVAVLPGVLANPVLTRVVGIGASRAALSLDAVERAMSIATIVADAGPAELAGDGARIELAVLGTEGQLELSIGPFREGGAQRLAQSDAVGTSIASLANTAVPVRTGKAERLAIEIANGIAAEPAPLEDVTFHAIERSHSSGVAVIAVRGDIDVDTAPSMKLSARHAILSGEKHLVLDLTEATFLDSTGIAVLVGLANLVGPSGGIAIANVNPSIDRALEITGLRGMFTVRRTVDDAAADLLGR